MVADVVEVLFRGPELPGADCAAQDDDGHEEAEERHRPVASRPLDLADPASSEAPVQHSDSPELNRKVWNCSGDFTMD